MPLLNISHLSIAFADRHRKNPPHTVVDNLSLQIAKGETVALVGESGSGKSVTALSILRLLNPLSILYPQGDIKFNGQSLLHATEKELQWVRGNEISMIFQEPMVSLNPLQTIEKQLTEVLILHRQHSMEQAKKQVLECLERVGIRHAATRLNNYPHQLSGGERQRVMIAMAILTKPKLLIADEPTTALDVSTQAQILSLLRELKQELNMSLLFITHNLRIVQQLADKIAVMQRGKCVEQGTPQDIFTAAKHPYTQQLISANMPQEALPIAKNQPTLLEVGQLRVAIPIKKGLFQRVVDHKMLVNNIHFSLKQGETLGLVGESGSGKSTTGLALLKLIKSSGTIRFYGQELQHLTMKQMVPLRSKIQIVFQDPYSALNPRLTVEQIISEGITVHQNLTKKEVDKQVCHIMQEVGLDPEVRYRYPSEFSGGQRQRIAIARALVLRPQLLILDEPTSSLDNTVQAQILKLLKELQQRYQLTYIFISHDLRLIRSLCHQVIVLKQGEVVEQGECQQVFQMPKSDYMKELLRLSL